MNHGSAESIALLLEYASTTLEAAGSGVEPKEPEIYALPQEKADWLTLVTEIRKLKAEVTHTTWRCPLSLPLCLAWLSASSPRRLLSLPRSPQYHCYLTITEVTQLTQDI